MNDLFLNDDYLKFYDSYKREKDNLLCTLEGNINRMCVCDSKNELFTQYYFATVKLQQLLQLRSTDFAKREELGFLNKINTD